MSMVYLLLQKLGPRIGVSEVADRDIEISFARVDNKRARDVAKLGYRVCFGSRRPAVRIRPSRPKKEQEVCYFLENIEK